MATQENKSNKEHIPSCFSTSNVGFVSLSQASELGCYSMTVYVRIA